MFGLALMPKNPQLLDQIRGWICVKHQSLPTEQAEGPGIIGQAPLRETAVRLSDVHRLILNHAR